LRLIAQVFRVGLRPFSNKRWPSFPDRPSSSLNSSANNSPSKLLESPEHKPENNEIHKIHQFLRWKYHDETPQGNAPPSIDPTRPSLRHPH